MYVWRDDCALVSEEGSDLALHQQASLAQEIALPGLFVGKVLDNKTSNKAMCHEDWDLFIVNKSELDSCHGGAMWCV